MRSPSSLPFRDFLEILSKSLHISSTFLRIFSSDCSFMSLPPNPSFFSFLSFSCDFLLVGWLHGFVLYVLNSDCSLEARSAILSWFFLSSPEVSLGSSSSQHPTSTASSKLSLRFSKADLKLSKLPAGPPASSASSKLSPQPAQPPASCKQATKLQAGCKLSLRQTQPPASSASSKLSLQQTQPLASSASSSGHGRDQSPPPASSAPSQLSL